MLDEERQECLNGKNDVVLMLEVRMKREMLVVI